MAAVPGRVGRSLLGDESLEFWRGPLEYIEKRRAQYGDVFLGRILNKPTIFATSSSSVSQLLNDNWSSFTTGYREYMFELFDENLIFLNDDAWQQSREALERVFDHSNLTQSLETCRMMVAEHVRNTPQDVPVAVYQHFKVLSTQISIKLFLSHLVSSEEAQEISQLMTTHWHGIISIPVNFKLPLLHWKSGYNKALIAKERLVEIITEKLKSQPSEIAAGVHQCCSDDLAIRNILLFISALIPKALASMMTSILVEISRPENHRYYEECLSDTSLIEDVILETQRLWPPFFGGKRICTKSCKLNGFVIPEGHGIVYISHTSNRDPSVFKDPDSFRPERWRNENSNDKGLVWTFGGGPRGCIGSHLTNSILKEWLHKLLLSLKWKVHVNTDELKYKLLPVCRPSDDVLVTFSHATVHVDNATVGDTTVNDTSVDDATVSNATVNKATVDDTTVNDTR